VTRESELILLPLFSCWICAGAGKIDCGHCGGTGKCPWCKKSCDACDSTGKMPCPPCGGQGVVEPEKITAWEVDLQRQLRREDAAMVAAGLQPGKM